MLLIVTNRDDLTADWLILELHERQIDFVRFNTEDYPQRVRVTWNPRVGASLTLPDRTIAAVDITSVWWRRPVAPRLAPGLASEEEIWAQREALAALHAFWDTITARWVSHPDAIRRASSKPRQLTDAMLFGFDIPDTRVTNDPAVLNTLRLTSPDGVICKPLTHGRVRDGPDGRLFFTKLLPAEGRAALGGEPFLFQTLIPKRYDVRVTVIGTEVFATRINSQTVPDADVDWRRGSPEQLIHEVETLPLDIVDKCRALVSHYGLLFGAIDLARRLDGGYTFFEINPNGQWAWIEQRTDIPLRTTLADLLTAR